MLDTPTPQGWYPAPDNPMMVRFWDGEVWTDRTRPAPESATGTGNNLAGPDHFVQHSALVESELGPGETIKLGYQSTNGNTGRKSFVVATEHRLFVLECKYFRRSQTKSVESVDYDKIDTVGEVKHLGGPGGIVTSGERMISLPYHGGGAPAMVAWIRTQINTDDDVVDIRSLPNPRGRAIPAEVAESSDSDAPHNTRLGSGGGAPLGVADEIRKLDALRDEGLLTDAEFDAQKRRLLSNN